MDMRDGAAISAFPLDAKIGSETEANECSYKTGSEELISDREACACKERLSVGME